jgi:hypothetical protein
MSITNGYLWLFAANALCLLFLDKLMLKASWRVAAIHAMVLFTVGGVLELTRQVVTYYWH